MGKLSKVQINKGTRLTDRLSSPFSLCFKHKLFRDYNFLPLTTKQIKEFQNFLDIVSQMSFQEAEKRYRRKSDKTDTFQGEQIIHYGISDTFRIHGIIENSQFVVLRLDPFHHVHKD